MLRVYGFGDFGYWDVETKLRGPWFYVEFGFGRGRWVCWG